MTTPQLVALVGVATALLHVYLFWRLWVYYVAVMHLKKIKDSVGLPDSTRVPAALALIAGFTLDAYLNVVAMTLITGRWPRELTVSHRLKRYNQETGTWGKKVATFFEPLLDVFDTDGDHI